MGIDIKNENNIDCSLFRLQKKQALIVVADLDIPGINENICKNPIFKQDLYDRL